MPRPFAALSAIAAALVVGTVRAEEPVGTRILTGTVLVHERIALPEDMALGAELTGPLGARITGVILPGAAVADLTLEIPADAAGVLTLTLLAADHAFPRYWRHDSIRIEAGGPDNLGDLVLRSRARLAFANGLTCGGLPVTIGVPPGEGAEGLIVEIGADTLVLVHDTSAASGRYSLPDEGDTWFEAGAGTATLSLSGRINDCLPVPDRVYSATGEDWSLSLTGSPAGFEEGAAYLLQIGASEGRLLSGQAAAPVWRDGASQVDLGDEAGSLRVTPRACRSAGMLWPESVEIQMAEETLTGCGGDPHDLLMPLAGGQVWVVEDIGGGGIIDGSRLDLAFAADGRASGRAGCNRWTGQYSLTGDGLTIGPAAMTRMACAEALMLQEQRFTQALQAVAGFDLTPEGALILTGADGTVLIEARPGPAD